MKIAMNEKNTINKLLILIAILYIVLALILFALCRYSNWNWCSDLVTSLAFPVIASFMAGIGVVYISEIKGAISKIDSSVSTLDSDISKINDSVNFNTGLMHHEKGEYDEAFTIWEELAKNGNMHAQHNLALMYDKGKGVSQNYEKAFKWYIKAAKQGHALAQNNLGKMYYTGEGGFKNYIKSYMWFKIAITNGSEEAKELLQAIEQEMTPEQIAEAKEMAKRCVESDYEYFGEE